LKKIIVFFILISLFSCIKHDDNKEEGFVLNLMIKDKKLFNFFHGSRYYGIKGISYRDSLSVYNFKIKNKVINFKMKNKFISGFKKGWILENPINFYLHDLTTISSIPLEINFNNYKKKYSHFLPIFSRENLELFKNRSSKIYTLDENISLSPIYYSDEYEYEKIKIIDELIFHSSTKKNLEILKKLNIYPEDYSAFLIIHNPLTGLYTCLPDFDKFDSKRTNILNEIENRIKYEKESEIVFRDTLYFKNKLNIKNDFIYENKTIIFQKGFALTMSNDSNLIFKSCDITFNGTNDQPIFIEGLNDNSIFFEECKVNISYTNFRELSNLQNEKVSLPSAITFYNSDAIIQNSNFVKNYRGDDFINFYNSKFIIQNSLISDSFSDAIDSDFSHGEINNLSFENIGNDALDFSGSNVEIQNSYFNNILDKAVSAGESSQIKLKNSNIFNSELAIVVKDGSHLISVGNTLNKNKVDYSVFFKKDFYPSPQLTVDIINYNAINLFQKGTKLNLKSALKIEYLDDVESLLYGKIYGKSSN
jgi:hypothetical protein